MIRRKGNVYKLDTPASTLLLRAGEDAEYLYYGGRLDSPVAECDCMRNGIFRPAISCAFSGGIFLPKLEFRRARITDKPDISPFPASVSAESEKANNKSLCLEFSDEPSKLRLYVYYTTYDDSDGIAVSVRLVNGGKKEVRVGNLPSLTLDLCGGDVCFVPIEGKISSASSPSRLFFGGDSFAILKNGGGRVALSLLWSGGYRYHLSRSEGESFTPFTRVSLGTDDFLPEKILAPGEELVSPEAVMAYGADTQSAARALRDFADKHILRGKQQGRERPVVADYTRSPSFCSLSAEEKSRAAAESLSLGAEVFLLDGKEETAALTEQAEKIKSAGLKVGLRVDFETAGASDEIALSHPEYLVKGANKGNNAGGRFVVDLTDERAAKYVFRRICAAVSASKAAYLEWDVSARRAAFSGEGGERPSPDWLYRYSLAAYALEKKLSEKFPTLLLGLSSDGELPDLGTLAYCSAVRLDASPRGENGSRGDLCARFAAEGISRGYPCSIFLTGLSDFSLSSEEKQCVGKRVAFFRKYRKVFEYGAPYRLGGESGEAGGMAFVSDNRSCAVAVFFKGSEKIFFTAGGISFFGLDEGGLYAVNVRRTADFGQGVGFYAGGELLAKGSLPANRIFQIGGSEDIQIVTFEKSKKENKG